MERVEAYTRLSLMFKDLARAEAASLKAAAGRHRLPPGSSRARVTTANARWAQAAEHRDRVADRIEERTGIRPAAAAARLQGAPAAPPAPAGAGAAPPAVVAKGGAGDSVSARPGAPPAAAVALGRAVTGLAAGLGKAIASVLGDAEQREALARAVVERARADGRLRVRAVDVSSMVGGVGEGGVGAPAGAAVGAGADGDEAGGQAGGQAADQAGGMAAFVRAMNGQLRPEEHHETCPVRHGASADCVWPLAVCLPVLERVGAKEG